MVKKVSNSSFCYNVSIGNVDAAMTNLIHRLNDENLCNTEHRLIPLIIQLNIEEHLSHQDIILIRMFLKHLRKVQLHNFVRFRCSLLWAAESDNTDIFYTIEENKNRHTDVMCNIRVIDKKTLILDVKVLSNTNKHEHIRSISKSMLEEVTIDEHIDDEFFFISEISRFYKHCDIKNILTHTGDDSFHVLFIPDPDDYCYYPLPIYGMSKRDAKYRYLASEKTLEFLNTKHPLVLREQHNTADVLELLVELLQIQVDHGDRYTLANQIYSLTELLYAYQMVLSDDVSNKDSHLLLLFEVIESVDKTTHVEIYNIEHNSVSF